jgi:hypothetical protein
VSAPTASPALRTLDIADPPERWAALGFTPDAGSVRLGGLELQLGIPGRGIVSWGLSGLAPTEDIDGLATKMVRVADRAPAEHPNGAIAVDHVVVVTPDFDRTSAALSTAGLELRRIRPVPERGIRQGFRRVGPAILELVEAPQMPAGPARFWGLVVVVTDLEALAERLGDRLGAIKPAVQPGRQIATLRAEAGLTAALAFMDPDPEPGQPHAVGPSR